MKILFQNQLFFVLEKEAGESFHSEEEDGVIKKLKALADDEVYSVHRLDKVTSGLLLVAKSSEVAKDLSSLFEERRIEKKYLAVASGKPKKKQGQIVGDMSKSRRSQYKLLRSTENPARTSFESIFLEEGKRLYLLSPKTGKTHQLRVAMKSLGVPILGDTLYGADDADRVYLHAYRIKFELAGETYQFESLPNWSYNDINKLIRDIEN